MNVYSYAMAQPYKVAFTVPSEDVKREIDSFWEENGEELMQKSSGGWTKLSAFKKHKEQESGIKIYHDIVWKWAIEAIKQSGRSVENVSAISVEQLSEEYGAIVSVVVDVTPTVKLNDYKHMKIMKPNFEPSDKEIEGQIFLALNHSELATTEEIDKELEVGDTVNLSYKLYLVDDNDKILDDRTDIVKIRGPEEQGASVITNLLIGKKTHTEVTENTILPDNFPNPDFAGEEITCEFKIGPAILRHIPSEEEEAEHQNMSLDEWREKIRGDIKKSNIESFEVRKRDYIRTEAEKILLGECEVTPIPESMTEREIESLLKGIAAAKGQSVEEYMEEANADKDTLYRSIAPMAMRRIIVKLIVDAIAKAEKMEPSKEDEEECFASYAEDTGADLEEVKESFKNADTSFIVKTYMVDKLLNETIELLPYEKPQVDDQLGDPTRAHVQAVSPCAGCHSCPSSPRDD